MNSGTNLRNLNGIVFADDYVSVQAAIDSLPITGGVVYVRPGTYVGPSTLKNNTQIISAPPAPTSASINGNDSISLIVPDNKTIFTYTADFVMDSLQSVKIDGIVLDFGGFSAGLVIKGCTNCEFPNLSIQNVSGSAAQYGLIILGAGTLQTHQSSDLHFGNLYIMGSGSGILLQGAADQSNVVAVNRFDRVYFYMSNGVNGTGINFSQGCDTNSFGWVFMSSLGISATGVIFNSANPTVAVDADNNNFDNLIIQTASPGSFSGAFIQINQSYGNSIHNFSALGAPDANLFQLTGNPIYWLQFATDFSNGLLSSQVYLQNVIAYGAPPTLSAGRVGYGATTATSATAGTNGAVPGQVWAYLQISIGGQGTKLIPLFNP